MWWTWAHLIDDQGADPANDTFTVRLENEWAEDTVASLIAEVRAQRAAKRGEESLPVYVELVGSGLFLGGRVGPYIGMARRAFGDVHGLTLNASQKRDLVLRVSFEDNYTVTRLSGSHPRYIHYPKLPADDFLIDEARVMIIANTLTSAYLALRAAGFLVQARALLVRSVPHASAIYRADVIGRMMRDLISGREEEALLTLIRRVMLDEASEIAVEAAEALLESSGSLSAENRHAIAELMESVGRAEGRANLLYNAGRLLRSHSSREARRLYLEAASLDVGYESKGYWLRDVGVTYYAERDYEMADSYYAKCIEIGGEAIEPLLGDVALRKGHYSEAVKLYGVGAARDSKDAGFWALHAFAFEYLIDRFSIVEQNRRPEEAERLWAEFEEDAEKTTMEHVSAVLNLDLLSPFTLWRAVIFEREAGRPTLQLLLAGAIVLEGFAAMWDEALRAASIEFPEGIGLVVDAIKRLCRDEFIAFLYEDDFVDDEFRDQVLRAFDEVPEPEEPAPIVRSYSRPEAEL
ncbi:hypothetical protein [Clavibacter tessellarius]|uniref:hypothetical protein n=1 Tax=Clavibacter tessellarius TaxID=31965 RepID=UPI00324592DD